MSVAHCSVSSDGWVWPVICCPDKGSIVNALVSQVLDFFACSWTVFRSNAACAACCMERGLSDTSGDSRGGKESSRPGLRCCEPSGFRGDAWVSKIQPTSNCVNASVVSSCGFGGAAGFSVLKLWVQERTTQSALTKACPCSVAKPFLDVGEDIVFLRGISTVSGNQRRQQRQYSSALGSISIQTVAL